ncbi:hypothetical protein HMPREF1084_02413 [Clostridium butyricum 60E.3]|nr:hypothetical protein HMPREF1084_02413 [Clostridium butyricum 60E.3]
MKLGQVYIKSVNEGCDNNGFISNRYTKIDNQ